MNIPIKQLKKWIAALDSGEYKQGKYTLQHGDEYCCIGVACNILIPRDKMVFSELCEKWIGGSLARDQPGAPEWLRDINIDFQNKTGFGLTDLNDNMGLTFSEIATLLELVYIHKILD